MPRGAKRRMKGAMIPLFRLLAFAELLSLSGTAAAQVEWPPSCVMPSGWTIPAGATTGWSVSPDEVYSGSCSLKSGPMANAAPGTFNKAQIEFTQTFHNQALRFAVRVSSQSSFDCVRLFFDGVEADIGSACAANGGLGLSG